MRAYLINTSCIKCSGACELYLQACQHTFCLSDVVDYDLWSQLMLLRSDSFMHKVILCNYEIGAETNDVMLIEIVDCWSLKVFLFQSFSSVIGQMIMISS